MPRFESRSKDFFSQHDFLHLLPLLLLLLLPLFLVDWLWNCCDIIRKEGKEEEKKGSRGNWGFGRYTMNVLALKYAVSICWYYSSRLIDLSWRPFDYALFFPSFSSDGPSWIQSITAAALIIELLALTHSPTHDEKGEVKLFGVMKERGQVIRDSLLEPRRIWFGMVQLNYHLKMPLNTEPIWNFWLESEKGENYGTNKEIEPLSLKRPAILHVHYPIPNFPPSPPPLLRAFFDLFPSLFTRRPIRSWSSRMQNPHPLDWKLMNLHHGFIIQKNV